MTTRVCPKCSHAPCMCKQPWCPETRQCLCTQHNSHHCAGEARYTSEYNIGDRPCCQNLKKCVDKSGFFQWCSHTGKCPDDKDMDFGYPPGPAPFTNYYDFFVKKENFVQPKAPHNGFGVM